MPIGQNMSKCLLPVFAFLLLMPAASAAVQDDQIVFTAQQQGDDIWNVTVISADGTGQRNVTKTRAFEFEPVWSPDRTLIAFAGRPEDSGQRFVTDIFVIGADGSGRRALTEQRADTRAYAPCWSSDGKRILYTVGDYSGVHPSFALWSMNADGSNPRRVASGRVGRWSPDGQRILFERFNENLSPQLSVMNADGTGEVAIADEETVAGAWSPDGKRIAFCQRHYHVGSNGVGISSSLHVCDIDGSKRIRLRENGGWPCWSQDGRKIYFTELPGSVAAMNADGSGYSRLTSPDVRCMAGTGFGELMFLTDMLIDGSKTTTSP